jgi:hypothetical protein
MPNKKVGHGSCFTTIYFAKYTLPLDRLTTRSETTDAQAPSSTDTQSLTEAPPSTEVQTSTEAQTSTQALVMN